MDEFRHSGSIDSSRRACGFPTRILNAHRTVQQAITLLFLFRVVLCSRRIRSCLSLLGRGSLRGRFFLCRDCGMLGFSSRRFFALLLALAHFLRFTRGSGFWLRLRFLPTLYRRWRWRRRWWGFERLQEFDGLGARAQLAVEQKHEYIFREFGINRQIGRNAHLGHLRQRDSLLKLPPFTEEVLDLVRGRLVPRGG